MSLVLHIGWPKTATSFLQLFFAQNINLLKSEGVYYPEFFDLSLAKKGKYGQGNGFSLAYSLLEDKEITICNYPPFTVSDLGSYLSSIDSDKIVLVSTEWFTMLEEDKLLEIKNAAKKNGHDVNVIAYLRPIEAFLESKYAQGVKQGVVVEKFEDTSFNVDYLEILQRFKNIFGMNSINVRPFSKSKWLSGTIEADFLFQIGVENYNLNYNVPNETNVSLHPKILLLQRFLNSQSLPFLEQDLLLLQNLLLKNKVFTKAKPGSWINERTKKEIYQRNHEQVTILENKYFDNEDGFLFSCKNKEVYNHNLLTDIDVNAVINFIRRSPLINSMHRKRRSDFYSRANTLQLFKSNKIKSFLARQ